MKEMKYFLCEGFYPNAKHRETIERAVQFAKENDCIVILRFSVNQYNPLQELWVYDYWDETKIDNTIEVWSHRMWGL